MKLPVDANFLESGLINRRVVTFKLSPKSCASRKRGKRTFNPGAFLHTIVSLVFTIAFISRGWEIESARLFSLINSNLSSLIQQAASRQRPASVFQNPRGFSTDYHLDRPRFLSHDIPTAFPLYLFHPPYPRFLLRFPLPIEISHSIYPSRFYS